MSETPNRHVPNAHHERIAANAGRWNVACTFFMGPDLPPVKASATDTVEMTGPFFATAKFESPDMFGAPFQGFATMGYDNARERYVSTWIDSMNSSMYFFDGQLDEESGELRMSGANPDPTTGEMTGWRTVEKSVSADERTFEMYYVPLGKDEEMKICEYSYTRASS